MFPWLLGLALERQVLEGVRGQDDFVMLLDEAFAEHAAAYLAILGEHVAKSCVILGIGFSLVNRQEIAVIFRILIEAVGQGQELST